MTSINEYPSLLGYSRLSDNKSDVSTDNEERQYPEITPKKNTKLHAKSKTSLCKNYTLHGVCPYGPRCQFAHGPEELKTTRNQQRTYKTKLCQAYSQKGQCQFGERCNFIHAPSQVHSHYQRCQMLLNYPHLLLEGARPVSRLLQLLEE